MKKLFSILLVSLFSFTLYAQSNDVTLNIRLYPVQSIEVIGEDIVNLDYTTKYDYLNGVSSKKLNHLKVFSTGSFAIQVKSQSENLVLNGRSIPVSDVTIIPTTSESGLDLSSKVLSVSDEIIASSSTGIVDKFIDIEYKASGDYINKYVNSDGNPNVFSTTVLYTIIPQ